MGEIKTNIYERIATIKSKLAMARKYETDFRAYGAETHQYLLNSPAAHSLISAFEEKFEVILPEEYVAYLTQMGNGGAGPHYGIVPLTTEMRDSWALRYSHPFKLYPQPQRFPEDPIACIDKILFGEMLNGLHYIGEYGHTITCLIVKGEEKGRIVYVDEERRTPPILAKENSFLDWYNNWISTVIDRRSLLKKV